MKKHLKSYPLLGVMILGATQLSALAQSRDNPPTGPQPNVGTSQPNAPAGAPAPQASGAPSPSPEPSGVPSGVPSAIPSPAASGVPTPSASGGPSIESVTSLTTQKGMLGDFITDANGRSLYIFDIDPPKQSKCTDQCAKIWIPAKVPAGQTPSAVGEQVKSNLIGSIQREDGTTQLTYNDMPLYFYVQDKGPGDTRGQGVHEGGGNWFLVKPDGSKLMPQANPPVSPGASVPGASNPSPSSPGAATPGSATPGSATPSSTTPSALESAGMSFLATELMVDPLEPQARDSDYDSSSYRSSGGRHGGGGHHGGGHHGSGHGSYNSCYYWGNCGSYGGYGGYGCGYYTCYYNGYCCNNCSCYYQGSYY